MSKEVKLAIHKRIDRLELLIILLGNLVLSGTGSRYPDLWMVINAIKAEHETEGE